MHLKTAFYLGLIVTMPILARAQTDPAKGALGVEWGAPKEKVIEAMSSRPEVQRDTANEKPDLLFFSGGNLAGFPVVLCAFRFVEEQLYSVVVVFKTNEKDYKDRYESVTGLLKEKYGAPAHDFHLFKYPYNKLPPGTFDEKTAIRNGDAIFMQGWEFPNPKAKKATVFCTIDDDFAVKLTYENEALAALAVDKKKAKQKQDL